MALSVYRLARISFIRNRPSSTITIISSSEEEAVKEFKFRTGEIPSTVEMFGEVFDGKVITETYSAPSIK